MNVLILQSFLAVSLSSASATISLKSVQVLSNIHHLLKCQPLEWLNHFKCLDCIPSQLQVYTLLVPTMAEAVIVCSLDLMDSYYTLSVS